MKTKSDNPYEECTLCQTIEDCKHLEISLDGMGTPLPPDICPRPFETMRRTIHKRSMYKRGAKN